MDPSKTFPIRLLCTEPLERRWLLSGVAPDPGGEDEADDAEDAIDAPARAPDDDDDKEDDDADAEDDVLEVDDEDDAEDHVEDDAEDDAEDHAEDEQSLLASDEPVGSTPLSSGMAPSESAESSDAGEDEDDAGGDAEDELDVESPAASPAAAPVDTEGVELVEWEVAAPNADDEEVMVVVSAMPREVLDAFARLFPGATPIEGQFGVDDGEPEYDVIAEVDGREVDVTFTPGGELIETELELTSGELPREVLDWVRDNFGDAPIDEASVQLEDGVVSYEVTVADAAGADRDVEAMLRVPGATAPNFPGIGQGGDAGDETDSVSPTPAPVPDPRFAASAPVAAADRAAPADTETSAERDAGDAADTSQARAGDPAGEGPAQPMTGPPVNGSRNGPSIADASSGLARGARMAAALRALAAGAPAHAWLPQLEEMLSDVFPPLDAGAAECRLDELLAEIDALAQRLTLDAGEAGFSPSHLAVVAALVAVAQLYFLNSRRTGGGPTLVFNAAGTTWSWVVGTPTTTPRTNPGTR